MALLKTAWANLQDGLGNRFSWSHVKAIFYNYAEQKLLSTKLDEMDALIDEKIAKAMMSNVQVNDQMKVPTSALAYSMNESITKLNSDLEYTVGNNFISYISSTGAGTSNPLAGMKEIYAGIPDNKVFEIFASFSGAIVRLHGVKATNLYGVMIADSYSEPINLQYDILNGEWKPRFDLKWKYYSQVSQIGLSDTSTITFDQILTTITNYSILEFAAFKTDYPALNLPGAGQRHKVKVVYPLSGYVYLEDIDLSNNVIYTNRHDGNNYSEWMRLQSAVLDMQNA